MNAPEKIDMPTDGHVHATRFRARLQETSQRLRSGGFWEAVHCFLALEDPKDFEALLAVRTAEHEHDRLHDNVYPLVRKWSVLLTTWRAWTSNPTTESTAKLKAAFANWENHPHCNDTEQDVLYISLAKKAAELLIVVETAADIRRFVGTL